MNRVANLIQESQEAVAAATGSDSSDVISAYAHSAVVAETLSERFGLIAAALVELAESRDERELAQALADYSVDLSQIAEEAAETAEGLFESDSKGTFNEDVNEDGLEEHFVSLMTNLEQALELYAEFTEEEVPS